ncbi:hypothetical protein pdam_00008957 [Pocillopora damicornis]|uniref:Phospholipase A2-like domain-containing protein n=1 Tax=Pocillopora damicornis TaxID=46731 RepID=A0A3M6T614_POCDA|nr:hypothetical protein pdam_00008957 [Pocillopora damicornis]
MDRVSDKVGYDVMEINDKMTLWTQVNTPKETEKSQPHYNVPQKLRLNCSHMILCRSVTKNHNNLIGKENMVYPKLFERLCYTGRPKYRYPFGSAFDIHKSIGRLPKPRSGWTLPDHKCTGPYDDLESQLKYNPNTGEKLEIYDQPTGKTDAIAMQHDVNYAVCKDNKKMQE